MKTIKNIFAYPIIFLLAIVYMADRVILVLLPWIEVKSIQDWMPKTTDLEQIKEQFPNISEDTHITIRNTRLYMMTVAKTSIVRVCASVFIGMCLYLIF